MTDVLVQCVKVRLGILYSPAVPDRQTIAAKEMRGKRVSLKDNQGTHRLRWLRTLGLLLLGSCVVAHEAIAREKGSSASQSTGTGFAVGDGTWIVTAEHVVRGKKCVAVSGIRPESAEPATVVSSDPLLDIALLRIATPRTALQLADWSSVPVGLEALVIGYPEPGLLGSSPKAVTGLVSGEPDRAAPMQLFQLTAPIQRGNSGSPVIAPDGLIIGMVKARISIAARKAAGLGQLELASFAVKSSAIAALLAANGIKPETQNNDLEKAYRPYQLFNQAKNGIVAVKSTAEPALCLASTAGP